MKVYNLKQASNLLKRNGFNSKNPLHIAPTVFHAWYDSRHYAEEQSLGPFVSLWEKHGCVYAKSQDGSEHKIQKTVSFDTIYNYWDSENPYENEFVKVIENAVRRKKWDFRYDEEYPDTAGRNFLGILTNGDSFLFWHAFAHEERHLETCHIYDSITMRRDNEICSYPWTAENDNILLDCLNSLQDKSDYCGETSPLRTLKFKDDESEE